MLPALDFLIQGVSRAICACSLPVPIQGIRRAQSSCIHSALCEVVSHHINGTFYRKAGSKIAYERDAVAFGVVPFGVGTNPIPASTFVQVSIRTCNKTARDSDHETKNAVVYTIGLKSNLLQNDKHVI